MTMSTISPLVVRFDTTIDWRTFNLSSVFALFYYTYDMYFEVANLRLGRGGEKRLK